MEANLDRSEIVTRQQTDELIGEYLLQAEYSINNEQKLKSRHGFRNLNESIVLDRPITPSYHRQSIMLQTKPFNTNDIGNSETHQSNAWKNKMNLSQVFDRKNSLKLITPRNDFEANSAKSTNILVINSQDDGQDEEQKPPQVPSKIFSINDATHTFASRPKIQRTPDQSMTVKKTNDSLNSNESIKSASSSTFGPKFSIKEPRPSTANSIKSTKSPNQSNASTLK